MSLECWYWQTKKFCKQFGLKFIFWAQVLVDTYASICRNKLNNIKWLFYRWRYLTVRYLIWIHKLTNQYYISNVKLILKLLFFLSLKKRQYLGEARVFLRSKDNLDVYFTPFPLPPSCWSDCSSRTSQLLSGALFHYW